MKAKLIILLIILTVSTIDAQQRPDAPGWVPPKYKKGFKKMEADALRLAKILKATAKTVHCRVENGTMVVTMMRHDLKTDWEIKIEGATECLVESKTIKLERIEPSPSFGQCFYQTGPAFALGMAAGAGLCAAVR